MILSIKASPIHTTLVFFIKLNPLSFIRIINPKQIIFGEYDLYKRHEDYIHNNFEIDENMTRFGQTSSPDGWLKKLK